MTKTFLSALLAVVVLSACSPDSTPPADMSAITNASRIRPPVKQAPAPKSDQQMHAEQWVSALKLNDPEKEARLEQVIVTHLIEVRDFHNAKLLELSTTSSNRTVSVDQQLAADATLPKSVHENLMAGLHKDLDDSQVEVILDKYCSGRVRVNMEAYHAIVPDLSPEEEATLLGFLKQARDKAVDYKNKEEVVAIFRDYKTKCEDYLISKGRNWDALFQAHEDAIARAKTNTPAAGPTK